MKLPKKFKFLFAFLSLFYCISLIQDTYGKYVSTANGNAALSVARWNILINDQDIKQNSNFTNTISPVFNGSENIANSIIAPTAEGYFDVIINGTNADVSFKTTINIEVSASSDVKDLIITKYTIDNRSTEYTFNNNDYTLESTTLYTDSNKITTYRFYVQWNDGSGSTMSNSEDTLVANSGQAKLDINVNFTQVAS